MEDPEEKEDGEEVNRKSREIWVACENRDVKKMRAVRRIPFEERWGGDSRKWVKHVPWNRYKGDEYQDGEVPEGV